PHLKGKFRGKKFAEFSEAIGIIVHGAESLEDPDVGREFGDEVFDVIAGRDVIGRGAEEGGPAGFTKDVVEDCGVVALGAEAGLVEAGRWLMKLIG
ncbi:MAG: hypothetical protein Q9205_007653, partial [Flavoplaca limonia]